MEIFEKIKQFEDKIRVNKYNGELRNGLPYEYIKGVGSVLVSAPHSVKHFREGKIKSADMVTGAFALYLQDATGCHVLYRVANDMKDPNYDTEDEDGGYKRELVKIVNENDIKCVIDLHGAADSWEFDIDVGTCYSDTLNGHNHLYDFIRKVAYDCGIKKVTHNSVFVAPKQTVTNYVARTTGIPCMQLEVNNKFRDYGRPVSVESMVRMLEVVVKTMNDPCWWDTEM